MCISLLRSFENLWVIESYKHCAPDGAFKPAGRSRIRELRLESAP